MLSSSVELSTDCITVSSAVDSPTAGAATSPLKVHVVSALDPDVILDVVFETPTSVCRQSLRLITCVRVWYRRYGMKDHLTERYVVDVVCLVDIGNDTRQRCIPCTLGSLAGTLATDALLASTQRVVCAEGNGSGPLGR